MPSRGSCAGVLLLLLLSFLTPVAFADEVAPELEGSDLRVRAQLELRRVFIALPPADQRKLTGMYVAFDSSVSDPIAQVACDDDGDYVVLLSDAMLRLVSFVARAETHDEVTGDKRLRDYAAFLARSQTAGRRLLPPPPGFFAARGAWSPEVYEARLNETLSFVVAGELARARRGDLVCPKPTPTKESGDEVWSVGESRKAAEVAAKVYPGADSRDVDAITSALDVGYSERGAFALLHFFTELEIQSTSFLPTYLLHHPRSAARKVAVAEAVVSRSGGQQL